MKPCFVEVEAADEAMTIQDYDNNKLVDSGRLFFCSGAGEFCRFVRDKVYFTCFKASLWRF